MLENAGIIFLASLGIFIVLAIFLSVEKKLKKRVLFSGLRNWLDKVVDKIFSTIGFYIRYLYRYIIKLSWYYSLHKFLRLTLTLLVKAYDWLEGVFINNRQRAKIIKKEKKKLKEDGSFSAIAKHKKETSFSEAEKKEFLKNKLEGG